MRQDELDEPSHEFVRQRKLLRARVERAHLQEVPVTLQIHHVVIELNVRIENLAGAWIADVRAHGVLDGGGQPAYDRITNVLRTEVGILLGSGRDFGYYGVLEPGGFEGRLPILDPTLHP